MYAVSTTTEAPHPYPPGIAPVACFVADTVPPADPGGPAPGGDGSGRLATSERVASGELDDSSWVGDETGQLLSVRWAAGHAAAAREIVEAALARATPGRDVHLTANTEVHPWIDERLALAQACGFVLLQEKQGVWWSDEGQPLPAPEGVVVRTLAEVGRQRYVDVIAACTAGTLDRVDRAAVAAMGAGGWAAAFFDSCAVPEEAHTWYLIESPAGTGTPGEALGFVAVGAFDEEATGTILHIGVVPAHRGHGYVDQLVRLANRAARGYGWKGMLSDVDVENPPMLAAMARGGHRAGVRPWHKWIYEYRVPAS